jgi:hypothetical protein
MMDDRLTAAKSADLGDLTDMIHRLLPMVRGEKWGVFSEEAPTGNDAEQMVMPHIAFNLTSRVHTANRAAKWQRFGSEPDPEYPNETISFYRSWYTCQVDFTIYARTNKEARQTAEWFEQFMETYSGYFKEQGISEIIFREEKAPGVNSFYRQDLPYRTLCYEVRIERIMTIRSYDLNKLDVVIQEPTIVADIAPEERNQSVSTHLENNNFLDVYNQNFPR